MVARRTYDKNNPGDKAWLRRVYQAAKDSLPQILNDNGGRAQFREILNAFKSRHSSLCDDSIGDPSNPASPHWGHIVASAIQTLKKGGVIWKDGEEWVLSSAQVPPRQQTSPPTTTAPVAPPPAPTPVRQEEPKINERLLEHILRLNPSEFEKLVGEFLKAKGFSNVRVTGRTGDGGIDGECELPFVKLKAAFQAKRYDQNTPVGSPAVRNFKGGVVGRFDRGIFITTSSFTAGAVEEAEQPGVTIVLIDGSRLVREMIELGMGVKAVPVVRQEVDEGFFTRLENRP